VTRGLAAEGVLEQRAGATFVLAGLGQLLRVDLPWNLGAAMALGARLLLLAAVLLERAIDNLAAIRMDLPLLLLPPGRERTSAE
jgi:hypothetical protein